MLEQPDDKMLIALYQKALAMVLPSFIEGFGFPVLEAMALDCPVITSNCSSLIEVAEDAALLVDPHSHRELSLAMGKILMQKDLRQKLIKKGRARLADFSWKLCCDKTLAVYEELN